MPNLLALQVSLDVLSLLGEPPSFHFRIIVIGATHRVWTPGGRFEGEVVISACSFYSDAFAVNPVVANPTVYSTAIVSDLETVTLFGLDQVEVMIAAHLAKDDVANFQRFGADRRDGA